MADMNIVQFAEIVGISVERLQEQLKNAGIKKKADDGIITDEEKNTLLKFLRSAHDKDNDRGLKKVILKRKQISVLEISEGVTNMRRKVKSKTVNVEFSKKRTYVKRTDLIAEKKAQEVLQREEERAL